MNLESHLSAAVGYLELGMAEDANAELEQLPPDLKIHPEVLALRASIFAAIEAWEHLLELSVFLTSKWPQDSQHWIWLGYATRRCRSIAEAEKALISSLRYHDSEPIIHFNLACYAAQTADLETARKRLAHAIRMDPQIREMALTDPDLEPLWGILRNP